MSKFKLPSGMLTGLPVEIETVKATLDLIAATSQSVIDDQYYHFIRAMQQVVPSIDINKLTIPDFYALVAYVRIQTFPDSPIAIQTQCKGTVFDTEFGFLNASQVKARIANNEIDAKEPLKPRLCNHHHRVVIDDYSKLTVAEFDYQLPDYAQVPTVALLAEWKRLIRESRYRFIVPNVAWLKEGETLEDKILICRENVDLYDKLSKLKDDAMFGVASRVQYECPKCGFKSYMPMHLDHTSFIREV